MAQASHVPGRLDGKVALVIGSGRGIGAAIAMQLGKLGAKVVVNYANSAEHAHKVVADIQQLGSEAVGFKADVRDVSQTVKLFDDAVAHFGHLDIAVRNSGVVSFGHLKDVTEKEFDRVFSLNTRGQFFVAREAYRHLEHGGRIVLTSSNTSRGFSVPSHSVYSGSKGAIDSFVRILSKDCGDKNITVNGVAPGGTMTDMLHAVSHHYIPGGGKYTAEERQQMAAHALPLHRNGFPEDIANVVGFLVSKEGEWINGKFITLDGEAAWFIIQPEGPFLCKKAALNELKTVRDRTFSKECDGFLIFFVGNAVVFYKLPCLSHLECWTGLI